MDENELYEREIALKNAGAFAKTEGTGYLNPMQNYQGTILQLTNPESELYRLELSLRNMRLNGNGDIVQTGEPLLNDMGINSVLGQVQALMNQVTIMSNFEKNDIEKLMDYLADTLARDLMMNRVKYAVKNGYDRDKIYFQSLTSAFITLKRALDEGEKRFWRGSQQEITTRIEGSKGSNNKSFFNKMLSGSFK